MSEVPYGIVNQDPPPSIPDVCKDQRALVDKIIGAGKRIAIIQAEMILMEPRQGAGPLTAPELVDRLQAWVEGKR